MADPYFGVASQMSMFLLDLNFVTFINHCKVDCGATFSYILLGALRVVLPA